MMKRVVSVVLFLVMGMGVKAQAPTNVNAGLENGHFVLKWDAVEGAVHYQVYHKEATMPFRLVADTEDTNISDNAYYWPCLDNYYYVVSCFADGSEYESDTVSLSLQAPDFLATDCHGNEIHLYDILDHGQYVFLDFFHYTCGPCREQAPFVVESYRYYGCNRHDVYYMEVSYIDNDERCLLWCEEFGIEYPTISKNGGGDEVQLAFHTQYDPFVLLIAPDHSIVLNSWANSFGYEGINSLQSIIDALEPFEIEQHQCDYNVTDPLSIVDVYPNPADGFVNLSLEEYGVVRVYNVMGKLMDSFVVDNGQTKLVTERYPNGVFFIQADGKYVGCFVVQH